jgi:hypothetical protein
MLKTFAVGLLAFALLSWNTAEAKVRCFQLLQHGEEAAFFELDSPNWDHPSDSFSGTWWTPDERSGSIEGTYWIYEDANVMVEYASEEEGGEYSEGSQYLVRTNLLAVDCE